MPVTRKLSGIDDGEMPVSEKKQSRTSLSTRMMLQMAIRISLVVILVSWVSYYQSMQTIEYALKQRLSQFTTLRTQTEEQLLRFIEHRLDELRDEFIARYQTMREADVTPAFDAYFKVNDDGTAYPVDALYHGFKGDNGILYTGFSGGIDNEYPLTPDRRLRLVLAQEMLFRHGPGLTQTKKTSYPLLPSINFYLETPEKDLLVYWPGVPWYPDFKGGYDIATQGDFSKIFNPAIPYEERKSSWTGTYRDDVPKIWMVSFTMPVEVGGRAVAGLGADVSLTDLNQRLHMNRFEQTISMVVRRDGRVIAHPALEQEMIAAKGEYYLQKSDDPALRALYSLIAENPTTGFVEDEQYDRFVSMGTIGGPEWLLITVYPKELLNAPALSTAKYALQIGLLTLLIEVALLWWVLRKQVALPLTHFVSAAKSIAKGDLSVTPLLDCQRSDELGDLARALFEMVQSLEHTRQTLLQDIANREQVEDQLRSSEERWKFALEGSGQGVWDWDVGSGKITLSEQWKGMLGYAQDDIGDHFSEWETRLHPDDKSRALDALHAHIDGHGAYSVELRLKCKNGDWKWVLDRGMVVRRDPQGKPLRMIGTIADISEIKKIENTLRETNETLEQRVKERTHELELSRQQADVANQAKSQFLANMSHDIRTPMSSIIGMVTLALRTSLNEKQRDYLQKIEQAAQNLLGILNDILDISKIEAGKLTFEAVETNLSGLMDHIYSQHVIAAHQKNLAFSYQIDPQLTMPLLLDPLRLGQVLTNLVGNAIKFTPSGAVTFRANLLDCSQDAYLVRFEVRDSGIGLSSEEISRLFEPFEQADTTTSRRFGGTGLGLAICKQLVTLMGGKIGAQGEPDVGSTFWFVLPLVKAKGMSSKQQENSDIGPDQLAGVHILLAEDNPFNQQVAKEFLEQSGAKVTIASSGDEAIALLRQYRFDCVLMDVQMPVMDGYEATRFIRATPELADTVVIAMTANARDEDRGRCRDAGMNDFISKPINPRQLFSTLGRWLAHAGQSAMEADTPETGAFVDLGELSKMWQGNYEKIEKFALLFVEVALKDFQELESAVLQEDTALVSEIGHRAKSSSLTLGARKLADYYVQLEAMSANTDLPRIHDIMEKLRPLVAGIGAQVDSALKQLVR